MIDEDMALDCFMRSTGGNFSAGLILVESSIPDLVITKSLFTPKMDCSIGPAVSNS